jgi:hypothetical protein
VKKWMTLALVVGQCYPQYRAIRVIAMAFGWIGGKGSIHLFWPFRLLFEANEIISFSIIFFNSDITIGFLFAVLRLFKNNCCTKKNLTILPDSLKS